MAKQVDLRCEPVNLDLRYADHLEGIVLDETS